MAQVLATLAMQQTDQLASVCLPVFIMRAVAGSAASGPNQEVTPLPGIYFFDGWRVRPCMKIPTDLPQSRDPPERDVQRPAATTRRASTRYTCQGSRNQAEDGPSTRQQFEPAGTFIPWSSSMDHNSKRCVRLPKNMPRVAP